MDWGRQNGGGAGEVITALCTCMLELVSEWHLLFLRVPVGGTMYLAHTLTFREVQMQHYQRSDGLHNNDIVGYFHR